MTEQSADPSIEQMIDDLFEQIGEADTDEAIQAALTSQADKIRVISQACQSSGLFAMSAPRFADFKADFEATTAPEDYLVQSWLWLLDRIANAPTRLHITSAVRLCLPLMASYLPEQ